MPLLNPANEVLSWDGSHWNINNNRLFEARFEKYLNAPEETTEQDRTYQAILNAILDRLSPRNLNTKTLDRSVSTAAPSLYVRSRCAAVRCPSGCRFTVMAGPERECTSRRCRRIWRSEARKRKTNEWNSRVASDSGRLNAPSMRTPEATAAWAKEQETRRATATAPYATRLGEVMAAIKANQAKKELSTLQIKIEFQALLAQFFLQRRFQHVLIGTRFYQAVFAGGDTRLEVGSGAKDLFAKTTGMPPTVGTMDSMANEAIRDVRWRSAGFRISPGEERDGECLSKRLAEAFTYGEFMPEIRTLPREKKRKALEFSQKSYQLISALEVKDYTLAEKLVKELSAVAHDFDSSKPMALIEGARTVSAFHLAKARNAAVSGDKVALEAALKAATELWPRNPALAEIAGNIFSQGDVQQKALVDFDQLMSQHNYRQIYDDKLRYIAALGHVPYERQEQLKKVLEQMQEIDMAADPGGGNRSAG